MLHVEPRRSSVRPENAFVSGRFARTQIAVLSTAHFEVYKNADKQFHLARAKIILQSREDVLHDVLPPPFSLIKPILGLAWPVR